MSDDTDVMPNGYRPPQSPAEDNAVALGLKISLAMLIADLVARRLFGFEAPTWSVVTAAYLATNPPIGSAGSALRKVAAMVVGLGLGAAGAYLGQAMSGLPSVHFFFVGLVGGWLATRSADYVFAAVVGAIVTFIGLNGNDPIHETLASTALMIVIGCTVGPATVYAIERARAWLHGRRHAERTA